ncbi:mdm2-binding protein [Lepisosteus oculatus]|uniref:mdm2-binding protein n=1 Tax=Lepisosteus oculatus TaxID=7918 RepID=UPI0035F51BAA
MDRYVLVVSFNKQEDEDINCFTGLTAANKVYDSLKEISINSSKRKVSPFPPCTLTGIPAPQRCFFAIQSSSGSSQVCSSEWESVGTTSVKNDSEESATSVIEAYQCTLQRLEEEKDMTEALSQAELFEEAAEGLHQLSDKLPPPGKALLDVILLALHKEEPSLKEFLPLLGSLKHMQAWHGAKIAIVTEDATAWQKTATYLSAHILDPQNLGSCIDVEEIWRGNILIREKKFASEVRFGGFCLKNVPCDTWSSILSPDADLPTFTGSKRDPEVYHYYRPVLDLVQLVALPDLPINFYSSTEFKLEVLTGPKGDKSKLLLNQLGSLRGKVGALFALSCTVSNIVIPPSNQLSTQKWKEYMAKKPKSLFACDPEVKGENGLYLLLVQGTDTGDCKARLIHSASQINGAAGQATVSGLVKGKSLPIADVSTWLGSMPCLHGDQLMQRERGLTNVQTLALKEWLRRREENKKPASVPVNDLKALLTLAREQYLKMHDARIPRTVLHTEEQKVNRVRRRPGSDARNMTRLEWPERRVLQNFENQEKIRQKSRTAVLLSGSSDSLLGPKDSQRCPSAMLDAKELLKHFTPEGLPTGELQPLQIQRGENAFQISCDLTPRKVQHLPFNKAANSHYHGIEFCLDDRNSLDRDKAFGKLQSRLIRYETHTTCSKEPCPVPFALSPAPSPAVLSEPGSVPEGEAFQLEQKGELSRRKRLPKSESSNSLLSHPGGSSGHRAAARSLRDQPQRSVSIASAPLKRSPSTGRECQSQGKTQGQATAQPTKESRSQKHVRMLKEVVAKTLSHHGIREDHESFEACSQRLFEISKFYLKDLKTSRGLHEEMKKAANNNAKQVIDWILEKASKK